MTLKEKAHEYAINNVCNNCNNCQSKGYIGCDTFRFAKNAYIDSMKENDKLKEILKGMLEYLYHDDFSSKGFIDLRNKAEKLCKE